VKPQSAKNKGRILQKLVRDKLLAVFPSLAQDDVRSTSMGAGGEDILLSPAARKLVPYQIECKNKATSAIHTMYNQAKEHGNYEPLVVIKQNRDIPLVVVSLDHFLALLKEKYEDH
jgi:aromatic ring-opening dioxygenase catalytic subunit (LigB family)